MDDDEQRPQFTWDVRRKGRAWRRDAFDRHAAVRIGDPARWREALAALPEP